MPNSTIPKLRHVAVVEDPDHLAPDDIQRWAALLGAAPLTIDAELGNACADDLVTVIYTSGTTGPPKGVMLDHENMDWTMRSFRRSACRSDRLPRRVVPADGTRRRAHVVALHGDRVGYEVTTCPDPGQVVSYLVQTRPQFFFAVPRVWEKAHAALRAAVDADPEQDGAVRSSRARDRLADVGGDARGDAVPQALAAALVGSRRCSPASARRSVSTSSRSHDRCRADPVRDPAVLPQARRAALGDLRPVGDDWPDDMDAVPGAGRHGRTRHARRRGPSRRRRRGGVPGRQRVPRVPERTRTRPRRCSTPTAGSTRGDIGVLDDDGYLRIVDRKKELIITAGGKNISPANLESALKAGALIGQACVIGDNQPYIAALLVLDAETCARVGEGAWHRRAGLILAELAAHPDVQAEVGREVDEANTRFSQVERIKRWTLLADEWLPDSEELTPTMKLKRRGVHRKYADEIQRSTPDESRR